MVELGQRDADMIALTRKGGNPKTRRMIPVF
jgi:hypothetical protein